MSTHYEFYKAGFEDTVKKSGIRVGGIVHVGAHEGQEVEMYEAMGFDPIVLVEADPDLACALTGKFGERVEVIAAAAGCAYSTADLYVVDRDTQLSSLYKPVPCMGFRAHEELHKVTVPVVPLTAIVDDRVNVAVVDVQGAELEVMRGAPDTLDLVVLEVGTDKWYTGQPLRSDVERYMSSSGWKSVDVYAHGPNATWFDITYVRSGK